jgi:hypothetical protein
MAQKILTTFVDDIDGSEAEGTVKFGLDGQQYEIDLNAQHTEELRGAMARYVEHGRKIARMRQSVVGRSSSAGASSSSNGSSNGGPQNLAAAREWLRDNPDALNGRELKDRGRLPADLVAKVPDHILYGGKAPAVSKPATTTPATTATTADELAAGAADAGKQAQLTAQQDELLPAVAETPATTSAGKSKTSAAKQPKGSATAAAAEPATSEPAATKTTTTRRRTTKS